MALKNIVFDFDGVIGDTADIIFALFRGMDESVSREDFMAHHDGNVYEEPRMDFTPEAVTQFYTDYSNRIGVSHLAEAMDPIRRLAKSHRLFVISSNEEYAVQAVLREAKLESLFEAVYGYNTHKSKIVKFEMLRDNFGIDFAETVFITDTLGDIKEGNKIGVKVIAETFGFHPRERLQLGNPYRIVDSWDEIEAEIGALTH